MVLLSAVLLGACSASRPAQDLAQFSAATADITAAPDVTPEQTGAPVPPRIAASRKLDGEPAGPDMTRTAERQVRPLLRDAATPSPEPTAELGTAIMSGLGKWYDDGPGLYAATGWWHWGMARQVARVCGDVGCARVTIRDHMVSKAALIDLGPDAFRAICGPLSRGVCTVTLEMP